MARRPSGGRRVRGRATAEPLRVTIERSGLVESTHLVDVAVVDPSGTLRAHAGDPETVAYLRSAAKPVQASVCLDLGWDPPGTEQIAVACASHNGEPVHVRAVASSLAAFGLSETDLQCPPAWPLVHAAAAAEPGRVFSPPARIFHNCSGKHAGMLGAAVAQGTDPARYLTAANPVHGEVAVRLERIGGPAARTGGDGCGAPTLAFALARAARIYANLPSIASPSIEAMWAHPYLVAGAGRLCTEINGSVAGVVLKIGAEGLACGSLTADGVGFATKVRDGGARARDAATLHVLLMLGAITEEFTEAVLERVVPAVTSGARARVGRVRVLGTLARG